MIVLLVFSLLTIALSIGGDRSAFACSCLGIQPQKEAFEGSQIVFSGTVNDLETTSERYPHVIATFDVHTIWKGNITKDPLKLTTGQGGADCGYVFEENEEYLVYAYGEEGDLGATSCSRTMPLERAGTDLIALGQGDNEFSGEMATYTGSKIAVLPYLILGAVGAAVAVIATVLFMKNRK